MKALCITLWSLLICIIGFVMGIFAFAALEVSTALPKNINMQNNTPRYMSYNDRKFM